MNKTKIGQDINYSRAILNSVFTCKCKHPLLMFGCNNPGCENFQDKQLAEQLE